MNNRYLRSFLMFIVYLTVILLITSNPAYAVKLKIKPDNSIINSTSDAYAVKFQPSDEDTQDFFFLNLTIPRGYKLNLPPAGTTIGNYTMFDSTTGGDKIMINITSKNPDTGLVDVTYSTDYGRNPVVYPDQNIENIRIGDTTLKIINSTDNDDGYVNLSLGGTAGPIRHDRNRVYIVLNNGTLRNPTNDGTYTWKVVANASMDIPGNISTDDVKIKGGASKVVTKEVFDSTTSVQESLPLPAGNLTVNITTTSDVVVANLVMTLRNFTDDPMEDEKKGVESLKRYMFIGIDVPTLEGITFTAKISVNYSSVESILTIPEENLRLYRFNDTISTWEGAVYNYPVDTVNNIVSGDFNSFSTFGIMGSAAGGRGSGGGGGGSGGKGVTTSEPFENIVKSETYEKSLIANTPVNYTFKAPEHGIYEISVTGKENENDIALRLEALAGTSKLVTAIPPGTIYKNLNIWAGTKRINEAIIRFKVDNTWLDNNKAASSNIRMLKWDTDKWLQLETSETTKDGTSTSYEAMTDSFSVFAISSVKGVEVPAAVQTQVEAVTSAVTPVKTIVPESTQKTPDFGAIITIIAILLVVSYIRNRR